MGFGETLAAGHFTFPVPRHSLRQLTSLRRVHLLEGEAPGHLGEARAVDPRDPSGNSQLPKLLFLLLTPLLEPSLLVPRLVDLRLQRADALQLTVDTRAHRVLALRAVPVQRRHLRIHGVHRGQMRLDVELVHGIQSGARVQRAASHRPGPAPVGRDIPDGILHQPTHGVEVLVQALNHRRLLRHFPLRPLELLFQRGYVHVRPGHEQLLRGGVQRVEHIG